LCRVNNTPRLSQGNNKGTFHSHMMAAHIRSFIREYCSAYRKNYINHTHTITGKHSCTIQVSAELLMTEWLCRSVPYMQSAPLHNARKTSASEVHYSQEALYQMLYTLHYALHYILYLICSMLYFVILIVSKTLLFRFVLIEFFIVCNDIIYCIKLMLWDNIFYTSI